MNRLGYSVEQIGENTYLSRVFSLVPVKEILHIKWGELEPMTSVKDLETGLAELLPFKIVEQPVSSLCQFLIDKKFIPEGSIINFFDELTQEDFV